MSMFKSGGADSTPRLKQIRYDLRKKILAVVGGTVLVCTSLLLVFSFFWSHYQQEQFIRESVRLSTEGVREFIVRQRNWKTTTNLHELRLVLRSVINSNPYISRVVVYDEDGGPAGHMDKPGLKPADPRAMPVQELEKRRRSSADGYVLSTVIKKQQVLAYIRADVLRPGIDIATMILPNVLVISGMLAISLTLAFFWATRAARPLREVIRVADEVAAGESLRMVEVKSSDEAGVIAGLFNDINRKLQQRINDLEKLNKLAIETNSELDRVLLHNIIVTKFAEATGAKKVALITCDIATGELTLAAGINIVNADTPLNGGNTLSAQAVLTRKHVLSNELGKFAEHALFYNEQTPSPAANPYFLALPLSAQGRVCGIVIVGESEQFNDRAFDIESIYLYQTFATAAGSALENSRLYELAITDELTRVYIRRFFNQRLNEEIQISTREKTPLSLLALDIDYFKKVNDTYGHQTGDVVLQAFAYILQQATRCVDVHEAERRRDIIARTGGEEFSVILPKTSLAGAKQVSERIRQAVESYHDLKFGDGGVLKFTVSIGVAEHVHGQDAAELMRNADSALYEAKRGGRNRVVGWGESAADAQVQ